MLIGEQIRALRMEHGWSLSQLSQLVHYSKSYLSRVENGTRAVTPELAQVCDQVMDTDGTFARLVAAEAQVQVQVQDGGPATARAAEPEVRRRPVPAQLPAAGEMWGRDGELERVRAHLARHRAPAVIAVDGMGGVGKTTFAVSMARRLSPSYPGGVLFADLHAHGPAGVPAAAGDVAAGLLRGLGTPPEDMPGGPAEQAALLRSALTEHRAIVVLDDAESAAQVAPLLPGTGGSLVLVTSRRRLAGLSVRHGALRLPLGPLAPDDAVSLLHRALGRGAAAAGPAGTEAAADPSADPDPHAAARPDGADAVLAAIARHCAYLPLALRIAAERMAELGPVFAAPLAEQLGRAGERLDALAVPGEAETAVRPVLAWSYRGLPEAQARAFRLLALHPGAVAGVDAVAALLGEPPAVAARLVGELQAGHLVAEVAPGRYRMHDLLRDYARERAEAEESGAELAAATERVLAWYLHTKEAAADLLVGRGRHRVPIGAPPRGYEPPHFASVAEALRWCETERVNLLACLRTAQEAGSPVAWHLSYALWGFLFLRHEHHDQLESGRIARRAAARDGGLVPEACAELVLASAYAGLRRHAAADGHYRRSVDLFTAAGDQVGAGALMVGYAMSCMRQGRAAEAAGHMDRALALFTAAGSSWGQTLALSGIGEGLLAQGRPQEALATLARARELQRAEGVLWLEAANCTLRGTAHRELGAHAQAEACYREALDLHRRTGMRAGTAHALHQLGICWGLQGRTRQARQAWLQAWAVYESLGDPREQEVRDRLAGLPPCRAPGGVSPARGGAGTGRGRPATARP
ncbi:tetratricopeptide repeat protein [Streptomyces sp. NPDC051109]|uniref:tetratricopeptide repeat protein n=1 Tax=Streptomyces sp. NPDC051109 TaxID=3365642 RepID=UPI00379BB426